MLGMMRIASVVVTRLQIRWVWATSLWVPLFDVWMFVNVLWRVVIEGVPSQAPATARGALKLPPLPYLTYVHPLLLTRPHSSLHHRLTWTCAHVDMIAIDPS
jgi:hypothetical protein